MNYLRQNDNVIGRYQHPHFNPNKLRVGFKLLIPLTHWSESVERGLRIDESYHPSIKLITIDMELESVFVVGKVIGRVKEGVYDISLLSHVNTKEFNKMSLFDVRRFAVEKETYLITIYKSIHPCTDIIREYTSLEGNDQGVSYGLYDDINNDYNFEDTKKRVII